MLRLPTLLILFANLHLALLVGTTKAGGARAREQTSWQVHHHYQARGHLILILEGKKTRVPFHVSSTQEYQQLYFVWKRRASSLCWFQECEAQLEIDGRKQTLRLPPNRRLTAVQTVNGQVVHLRPRGPLTREQLDLLQVPGHPHAWEQILPENQNPLTPGSKWSPKPEVLASLLAIDVVHQHDVQCEVEKAPGPSDQIRIRLRGSVEGGVYGVGTQVELEGTVQVHASTGQVMEAELRYQEKRAVGHVGPGLDVQTQVTLRRHKLTHPQRLARHLPIQHFPLADPYTTRLELRHVPLGVQFQYDRRWHIVGEDEKGMVLRLVDRGELVAQCNIARLPAEKEPLSAKQWQERIAQTLEEHFGRWVEPPQVVRLQKGYQGLRLIAEGQVQELPILWQYWVLRGPEGRQAMVVFTLEPKLVPRFGNAERLLIHTFRFLGQGGGNGPTAAEPGQQKPRR